MLKKIFLINDTSLNQHHGCKILNKALRKILFSKKFHIVNRAYNNEEYGSVLKKLFNTKYDLILINGEGTLHDTNNYSDVIFKIINVAFKKLNVPIILINSVIQNLPKKNLNILKKCKKIYVRESYSFEYLKKNKINSKIVPDLLLSLDLKKNFKPSKNILITDSTLINMRFNLFELSKNRNLDFIPMMKRHDFTFSFNFLNVLRYIYGYFKNLILILLFNQRINYSDFHINNSDKFLKRFSDYRFIITGRFHSVILCIIMEIPFYVIKSNTYKIEGLLNDAKLTKRLKTFKFLKTRLNYEQKFSKSEINKIRKFKKMSKLKINKMFDEISLILKK